MTHKNIQAAILETARALGECSTLETLRASMLREGIVTQPMASEILASGNYQAPRGTMRLVRVRCVWRLWHVDSDTFEDIVGLGEAADLADGALERAIEAAYEIAMQHTFTLGVDTGVSEPMPADDLSKGGVRQAVRFDEEVELFEENEAV